MPNPSPILFEITASDSHLPILLPVMKSLHKEGVPLVLFSDCEILRTTSKTGALLEAGIPFVQLAPKPLPGPDLDWELQATPLRQQIEAEVARLHPSLVVVLNDRNFPSNTYVRRARGLGIPTLLLQESLRKDLFQKPTWRKLMFRWRRKILFGIEGGLRKYGQGGCDWVAAWGKTSVDYFRRVGVPAGRIRVTGNPRFDHLASTDWRETGAETRKKLGFEPGDFVLTFLSSPIEKMLLVPAEEKERGVRGVLDWVRVLRDQSAFAEMKLVFKLHRGEAPQRFAALIREAEADFFASVTSEPLYPVVAASNAVLMFSTTAGLEAALIGRAVGIVNLSRGLDDWDFAGRGVATSLSSLEDLAQFVQRVRSDPKAGAQASQAASAFIDHVGQATERVVELILEVGGATRGEGTRPS